VGRGKERAPDEGPQAEEKNRRPQFEVTWVRCRRRTERLDFTIRGYHWELPNIVKVVALFPT